MKNGVDNIGKWSYHGVNMGNNKSSDVILRCQADTVTFYIYFITLKLSKNNTIVDYPPSFIVKTNTKLTNFI
jgi:hypothetical protein